MLRFFIFSVLISLVFFASLSLAGIPKMINYQGMLTDNSGNPLSGPYNLTFKIWTDTTGGSSLWTETQNGVQVTNGLFNVILGRLTTLNLAFDQQYWLEVGVGAETMPRIRFTSVGYAYRAEKADTASVAFYAGNGGGWVHDGTVVRLQTGTDYVGIGTTNPNEEMEIYKDQNNWTNLRLNNPNGGTNAGCGIDFYEGMAEKAYIAVASSGNTNDIAGPNSFTIRNDGLIEIDTWGGKPVSILPYGGNVGIGTTDPERILHIAGDNPRILIEAATSNPEVDFKSSGDPDAEVWSLYKDSVSNDFRFYQNGDKVTFQNSTGNVGIGTTSPSRKLHIVGVGPRILIEASSGNPEVNFQGAGDTGAQRWALYKETISGDLRFYQNGDKVTIQNSTGNVGIGTTSPGSYLLAVNGTAAKPGGGSWSTFSDERLKDVRANYEYGLSEISQLKPVRYRYQEGNALGLPSDQEFVGLVAQNVQNVIPDAVTKNDKGYLMLNNDPVIWAMLNAIKELKAENEGLKKRIEVLEAK